MEGENMGSLPVVGEIVTIQIGSATFVQGELVRCLTGTTMLVQVFSQQYRGTWLPRQPSLS